MSKQAQYRALEWSARQLKQGWAAHQRQGDDTIRNTFLGALQRRAPDDIGPDFLRAQPIEDIEPVMQEPHRFQHFL